MKILLIFLIALTACAPRALTNDTRLPTSTANKPIVFKTYMNTQDGFAFEYPLYYDESFSNCALRAEKNLIYFGGSMLAIISTNQSLQEYVQASHNDANERVERVDSFVSSRGLDGMLVQSYWQNLQKTTVDAYFQHGARIYHFEVMLSLECMNQDKGIMNPDMFYHAVDTFRFLR